MTFILEHTRFGFCWWDIPAAIVLIGLIVYFIVKIRKQKKELSDLEDEYSSLCADDACEEADEDQEKVRTTGQTTKRPVKGPEFGMPEPAF